MLCIKIIRTKWHRWVETSVSEETFTSTVRQKDDTSGGGDGKVLCMSASWGEKAKNREISRTLVRNDESNTRKPITLVA